MFFENSLTETSSETSLLISPGTSCCKIHHDLLGTKSLSEWRFKNNLFWCHPKHWLLATRYVTCCLVDCLVLSTYYYTLYTDTSKCSSIIIHLQGLGFPQCCHLAIVKNHAVINDLKTLYDWESYGHGILVMETILLFTKCQHEIARNSWVGILNFRSYSNAPSSFLTS